jgi:hypothetical protein
MESFLPDTVKVILLALIALAFVGSRLARRFPDIAWLQFFRLPVRQMSEAERSKRRRAANRIAALEIMFAGILLPVVYFLSSVMFFSEPKTLPTIIVFAGSFICFGLGIWVLASNRQP